MAGKLRDESNSARGKGLPRSAKHDDDDDDDDDDLGCGVGRGLNRITWRCVVGQ